MTDQDSFTKEVMISGCKVRLNFQQTASELWIVAGTIYCGIGENMRRTVFQTPSCRTSEEAESFALSKASDLIGHNVGT